MEITAEAIINHAKKNKIQLARMVSGQGLEYAVKKGCVLVVLGHMLNCLDWDGDPYKVLSAHTSLSIDELKSLERGFEGFSFGFNLNTSYVYYEMGKDIASRAGLHNQCRIPRRIIHESVCH